VVLVATAVGGITGALGLQCSGSSMTSVSTTQFRKGPNGTSAENGYSSSGMFVTVTHSSNWACSAVTPFIFRAGTHAGQRLPRDVKRLASRGSKTDAHEMQKRANLARRGLGRRFRTFLSRLSLVLVATAVGGITGALGLQCSGSSMTSVSTTQFRKGPNGTSAENG